MKLVIFLVGGIGRSGTNVNTLKSFGMNIEKEKLLVYQELRRLMNILLQEISMTRIVSIALLKVLVLSSLKSSPMLSTFGFLTKVIRIRLSFVFLCMMKFVKSVLKNLLLRLLLLLNILWKLLVLSIATDFPFLLKKRLVHFGNINLLWL